jgi:hypothetical protein
VFARRSLAPLTVVGGLLALTCAPALAISQRGHTFSFAFGSKGAGYEQLSHPSGIAVNSAGDLYVADRANNRVEEYEPVLGAGGELEKEQFVTSFSVPFPAGIAVDDCTVEHEPRQRQPCTATEDESVGDVYVVGATAEDAKRNQEQGTEPGGEPNNEAQDIVYKFRPNGELIGKIKQAHAIEVVEGRHEKVEEEFEERISGVAVGASGSLFVDQGEQGFIWKFNDKEHNKGETRARLHVASEEAQPGFAVEANGENSYADDIPEAEDEADRLFEELLFQVESEDIASGLVSGEFAVAARVGDADGRILDPALNFEDTTALAVNHASEPSNQVDELDDVYLSNLAFIKGEKVATISEFSPEAKGVVQRFSHEGLEDVSGIAVDERTGTVFVTDAAADAVDVFTLESAGPPTVSELSACMVEGGAGGCPEGSNEIALTGKVDPHGIDTTVSFEYGTESCSSEPDRCTVAGEQGIGEGFGDVPQSVELGALPPGKYDYRLAATNAKHETTTSPERTFIVLAASASLLPDGRQWELVSPQAKNGAEPLPITAEGGDIQAAANGEAIAYVADGPMPANEPVKGNRAFEPTQVLSTRDPGEDRWASQDLVTPSEKGTGIGVGSVPWEYKLFSPSLALALVQPFPGEEGASATPLAEPALSPPLTKGEVQEKTFYVRANAPIVPQPSEEALYKAPAEVKLAAEERGESVPSEQGNFLALLTQANAPGPEFGGAGFTEGTRHGVEVETATPDMNYGVFVSYKAKPGLYEWAPGEAHADAPSIREVSVIGSTLVEPENGAAKLGGPSAEGRNVRHAISNDGAFVVWTLHKTNLEVRDTATGETIQLDSLHGGSGEGNPQAEFQTATADGSKVFFTDTQRLTSDARASGAVGTSVNGPADLYVAELAGGRAPGSPLKYTKLVDLTPEGLGGEVGGVLESASEGGGVIGVSEEEEHRGEGINVYFVANAALTPDATRGDCAFTLEEREAGTTCNLYLRHFDPRSEQWEPAKLIAALANEDQPDWAAADHHGDLAEETARVSPNGRYIAFMSNRSLTGYDNVDASAAADGARDEEVFRYDAESGDLVCASCNPSGTRPHGVFDPPAGLEEHPNEEGEGRGLLVDRRRIWSALDKEEPSSEGDDHWLAGNVPGWTSEDNERALYQSRYLLDNGRLFFDSPDHLVPAATGEKEKVYEYEPNHLGGCTSAGGCVALLSAGAAPEGVVEHESAFLDASETGDDVFFLTAERLRPAEDGDEAFDVYDARVCEPNSPCLTPPGSAPQKCDEANRECKHAGVSTLSFIAPASETNAGSSNLPQQQALPSKEAAKPKPTSKPKPLTRAQLLAKALKACKQDKGKAKRVACEKQARKKYGRKTKSAKSRKATARGEGR